MKVYTFVINLCYNKTEKSRFLEKMQLRFAKKIKVVLLEFFFSRE